MKLKWLKPQIINPHAYTDSHTQPTKCSIPLKYTETQFDMVKQWAMTISVTINYWTESTCKIKEIKYNKQRNRINPLKQFN